MFQNSNLYPFDQNNLLLNLNNLVSIVYFSLKLLIFELVVKTCCIHRHIWSKNKILQAYNAKLPVLDSSSSSSTNSFWFCCWGCSGCLISSRLAVFGCKESQILRVRILSFSGSICLASCGNHPGSVSMHLKCAHAIKKT